MRNERGLVERPVNAWAKKHNIFHTKMELQHHRGFPDDVYWIPGGRPIIIEFKSPGQEPTPLQWWHINLLRELRYEVHVCDTKEEGIRILEEALEGAERSAASKRAVAVPRNAKSVPPVRR